VKYVVESEGGRYKEAGKREYAEIKRCEEVESGA
jgi:hypothetical protein